MRMRSRVTPLLGAALLAPGAIAAPVGEPAAPMETLDRVVVTATRLETVDGFDAPASTSVVALGEGGARPQAALSEVLDGIPGVLARERQNLAQDTQLSIRGFGARSTFGVRGLRLYADGVPATMPWCCDRAGRSGRRPRRAASVWCRSRR